VIGAVENLTLTGTSNINAAGNGLDNAIIGNDGNNILAGLVGADALDGGLGIDTATYAASSAAVNISLMTGIGAGGDAEGDTLTAIENLTGSGLGDTLEGNAGNNVLVGGVGIDTVSYQDATAAVTVSLALTTAQNTVGAGIDTLTTFENLTGSEYDDTLTGSTAVNILSGRGGDDLINGGAGADHMFGGTGNDTYVVDNVGDIVDETSGDGTDLVRSSVTFSLSDVVHVIGTIDNLTLTGTGVINATGNASDNAITGNDGNNILAGLGGADALDGGLGIDTATYAASSAGVSVSLIIGITGQGGDAQGDILTGIENLTGSGSDDTLEGSAGNNVITGGVGNDTVSYEHAGAAVTVSLAITGAQNTVGAGTDTLTTFENLTGSEFDDTLTGSTAVNILSGFGGNDLLNGGTGADHMFGGIGNDSYVVDNTGDVVDETGGDGTDLVKSSITFSLSDATQAIGTIENLTLTGTGAINATGNASDNVITGNTGNNKITGAGGNDTMTGLAGNDTFVFAAGFGQDVIADFAAGAAATDVISVSHTIFANFAAVQSHLSLDGNNDVVLTADATNTITFSNLHNVNAFAANDFVFT